MAKFGRDDRVIFRHEGALHRGRVTRATAGKRRVVTDEGRRLEVSLRRLRKSPDRALLLETRLDRNLRSDRSYGPMMQQWLSAYGVQALQEKIHTKDAMRAFLRQEGKNIATRFVHIMGHGTDDPGRGKASLHLTFGKVDLVRDAELFAGLAGKVIIFSCCEVGADAQAMDAVKETSRAAAVIAYRTDVDDWYTNLAEALLYDRLIQTKWSPKKVVTVVSNLLQTAGMRTGSRVARKPVLVCV